MQQLIDAIIRERLHEDPAAWPFTELLYILGMLACGAVMTAFAAVFSGLLSWYERKIAARMQSRVGPNRAGPHGVLIWIADAIKLLTKEDLIPKEADAMLFRMAPYFVVTGFVLTFVALPFSHRIVGADRNIGRFYILSITALVVVGILLSGWASNSKWSLFGGIRSAAQVVSYEIPAGLAVLVPVIMAGSLSMQDLIRAQGGLQDGEFYATGGWPWNWTVFANPMAFVSFFVFFTAALAEGNRTPFDLPEAESELVAGYFTEYSGMRFAYFFLVEWANVWVMSALAVTLYLGGWQVPGVSHEMLAKGGFVLEALSFLVFVTKVLLMVNVVVWLRWTLPRIRVDQMMNLCWKYLVPISMALVLLTAGNEWILSDLSPTLLMLAHMVFFGFAGAFPLYLFAKQTARNMKLAGERVDLSNW
jgi:NADH-quinone oxidoreductase subunit H